MVDPTLCESLPALVLLQSQEEFQRLYLSPVNVSTVIQHKRKHVRGSGSNTTYPTWLDWRIKGFVTDVSLARQIPWSFNSQLQHKP